MYSKIKRLFLILFAVFAVICFSFQAFAAASGTHTPVAGVTVSVSGATDNSMSGGAVTVTAKGSAGVLGFGASAKTATITIYNNSDNTATLSFDWAATSVNQLKIDGEVYSGTNGKFSKALGSGENFVITITTAKNGTTNKLVMSNFSLVAAAAQSTVTLGSFNTSLGTATVGGSSSATGSSSDGVELIATPKSGINFLGWVNVDTGAILEVTNNIYFPMENVTVIPAFASSSTGAWFKVGANLFNDLNDACEYAVQSKSSTIILAADGTLPTGNYIIPAGVTLLIPYNDANTLCTTEPTITESNGTASASAYRMLTMASGAHITVRGAISVSGQQYCSRPIGAVSGKYGVIEMAQGSSITVESGGNLYAWGYIAGVKGSNNSVSQGTITIKAGGTVYEDFQVVDWRGGSAASSMIDNSNKVFPMSQYYVQNVQVPMTLESGATEITFTSVKVTLVGIQSAPVIFIGDDGMFVLGNNSAVTKDYDEATDRLILTVEKGSVELGSVNMNIKISLIGSAKIYSENYVLPLSNNISIVAKSNTALSAKNDIAMLPGSQIVLEEGSSLNITSGNFYIYDLDEWTYDTTSDAMVSKLNGNTYNNGGYTSEFNWVMAAVPYAHDRVMTRTTADLTDASIEVNGTITVSNGAYVYTTSGGANIYSTGNGKIEFKGAVGTAQKTYQAVATGSDRTGVDYCDIPIIAAMLKNGDGSYTETAGTTTATAYTYCSDCMAWLCDDTHGHTVNHATNVELGNSLNMYFAFWNSTPLEDWGDSYYVEIIHTDASGEIVMSTVLVKEQWLTTTVNNSEAWAVYYKGLSAKQMGDEITVKLYRKDKDAEGTILTVLVDEWSNSVEHYAMRMLSKHSTHETLRTLIVDMLNYGAACQKEFNYDTDNLVNAGLSAEQKSWATKTVDWSQSLPSGNSNHLANLIVDGNIQFAISGVSDQDSYRFTNHWGAERQDKLQHNEESNYYYISKLYVADARQNISITVNGTTYTDSVAAYCKRMIDKGEGENGVFTAFMKFSDAAKAYLEGGNRV